MGDKKAFVLVGLDVWLIGMEVFMMILFFTCTEQESGYGQFWLYDKFQHIHVMMFIGFGFLYTSFKKYSWSGVGFNFLLGALVLQFTILVRGFWHCVFKNDFDHKIEISIESLVQGNFGAAAVLISLGGYMGTVNASQLVIMAILEVIFYCLNVAVAEEKFHAMDIGGSMIIHSFGAYFGLAACKMRALKKPTSPNKSASYNSNIFAIIGTIFLWMYWPSFNSVLAPTSNIGVRVIVNTVLAIASSCLVTFSLSYRIHHGRFEMEEILNASLAGAVAVGTCADMTEHFGFAILIGILGGAVSTLGFAYLSACLERVLGLYDTAGINNLHGLPGILGGLIGFIAQFTIDDNSTRYEERSGSTQAGYQILTLLVTLVIAIGGGVITGWIGSLRCFGTLEQLFDDQEKWEIPDIEIITVPQTDDRSPGKITQQD